VQETSEETRSHPRHYLQRIIAKEVGKESLLNDDVPLYHHGTLFGAL
jgi:hypothetical protein